MATKAGNSANSETDNLENRIEGWHIKKDIECLELIPLTISCAISRSLQIDNPFDPFQFLRTIHHHSLILSMQ